MSEFLITEVRILDLVEFIDERHGYRGTLTVFPVEAVLREVPLKIVSHRGYGFCVELDAFKITKKIDLLRNGQADATPAPLTGEGKKRRGKNKGLWR